MIVHPLFKAAFKDAIVMTHMNFWPAL